MNRTALMALALYWGLVLSLVTVPYWFAVDSTVASASAVVGYNNRIAHLVLVLWSLIGLLCFAAVERRGSYSERHSELLDEEISVATPVPSSRRLLEIGIVFGVSFLLYFPSFLSKYGPYIEDQYFLTVLHRMHGGQQPYVDFESLYGPLMLYLPFLWTTLFGYSMVSYYALIASMEAIQFSIVLALLQRYLPKFRSRLGAFLLLSAFLFNTLLGMSTNGLRRLLPPLLILSIANRPRSNRTIITVSFLLGILAAYSHEFGAICLLTILGVYGLLVATERRLSDILRAGSIALLSVTVWGLSSVLVLGDGFSSYLQASFHSAGRFAAEASFPFYWTVNSLATFAFLCVVLVIVGRGMGRASGVRVRSGDLLLFGGLVYALLGMKSGLNRADMWHLAPPMLVLVLAFILPLRKAAFSYSHLVGRLARGLLWVMAATYFVALAPSGSYYGRGLLLGLLDSMAMREPAAVERVSTRAPTIELERSHPDPDILALGEYLADPARRERPVVLYRRLWAFDKRIGVYKTIYPTDDFLLSDESGYEVTDYLREREDAMVIMLRPTYERVFGLIDPSEEAGLMPLYEETVTKRILSWLSTVHYSAAEVENRQKAKRWERTVGTYISANYHPVAEFGQLVVLARGT